MRGLTDRQHDVLQFIVGGIGATGIAPTRQEVADHIGCNPNGANWHVERLAAKGHLVVHRGISRGIALPGKSAPPLMPRTPRVTVRQRQALEFIVAHLGDKGFAPTRAEIAEHLDCAINNADQLVRKLQLAGLIQIVRGVARGIRVVRSDDGH